MQSGNENLENNDQKYQYQAFEEEELKDKFGRKENNQEQLAINIATKERDSELNKGQGGNEQNIQVEKKDKIMQLKQILNAKIQETKELKKRIQICKKQMRDIGEEVDKQMNKSIAKQAKHHPNVNIHSIFISPKNTNPQINHLIAQLAKLRNECKKTKNELKLNQNAIIDPLNMMTNERACELKSKIKEVEKQLKKLREEKDYLNIELKLKDQSEIENEIGIPQQSYKTYTQKNAQICNEIKKQKSKWYDLEKQDRLLMEKIRFIQQLSFNHKMKRNRTTLSSCHLSKSQIEEKIHSLAEEIKEIINKRNKTENQRKSMLKNLEKEVSNIETKNQHMNNKLRDMDAAIIQYHIRSQNLQRRKYSQNQLNKSEDKKNKTKEKIKSNFIKIAKTIQTANRYDQQIKKMQEKEKETTGESQLMEKHQTYDFFMSTNNTEEQKGKNCLTNVIMSDQIFGTKNLRLKSLNFVMDTNAVYGVYAQYQNEYKCEVRGYKIMPRIKPKTAMLKKLNICEQQLINVVEIGIDENELIRYILITTSEGNQLKWGNPENCVKKQYKKIQKYSSLTIKGKLHPIAEKEAPNYYCLGGIGFNTVFLEPI